jgi:hypothetical protein
MSQSKKYVAPVSPKAIAASIALVAKAAAPFAHVVRMDGVDRQRLAKLKSGAKEVFPTIARAATKFALEVPGKPIAHMAMQAEYAASIEPLLTAVEDLYATLRDEYLRTQSQAWTTATVTYGVLRKASEANPSLGTEISSARKWFRRVNGRKATRDAATTATPTKATGAVEAPAATATPAATPTPAKA